MSKCIKCGNEILSGDIHWEMGLCNKCYNELYKDHNTHISLDKMWLKLAQDFRDENEQLQTKITDLQSQLAEKEEYINTYFVSQTNQPIIQPTQHQDKISFALEQLEQIRKEFEIKFKGCKWEDKMLVGKFCNITNEIIDNQINELKGKK